MQLDTLYRNLYQIGRGQNATYKPTVQALYSALCREDTTYLNSVLHRVAAEADTFATSAFDSLMDMFCAEPLASSEPDAPQWRCFALTVLIRRPAGLLTMQLDDCAPLEALIARHIGVDRANVRCDPLLLPTPLVFDHGPLQAFHQCHSAKCFIEQQVNPTDLRDELTNTWLTPEMALENEEAVILVGVRTALQDAARALEEFQQLPSHQPFCMLEAHVPGCAPTPVKVMCVDASTPWTIFCSALHTQESFELGACLRRLSKELSAPISDFQLTAAYVEEEDAQCNSVRISVLNKQRELVGGFVAYDLHEPEIFVAKANHLLVQWQCQKIKQIEQTYFNVEIDGEDEEPTFFTPGGTWEKAPKVFEA